MNNAKIGAAVLAGYVLGRTKKAKLALSLGAMLAGSKIKPGQVARVLQESPFLNTISEEVRTELTDAGKAAATTVLSAKAENLADAIHKRTEGLHERAHPDGERHRGEAEGETEREEEREDEEEDEEREGQARGDEGRRSETRRTEGRAKRAQHRGSDQEGESRRKRTAARKTAAQGRTKSGSARSARSRRPDDG
ncbi:ABC transporter substrate-binding protein [Streptomyces sp. NPDC001795]|uniref:ABC transporter substrate-binding protein n=1 Tax=unclassified Streptomyces TaxID=2593676 RepID=UPI003316B1A5